MKAKIRNLMDKHRIPESIMTLYGLEIERVAEDYANQEAIEFADRCIYKGIGRPLVRSEYQVFVNEK